MAGFSLTLRRLEGKGGEEEGEEVEEEEVGEERREFGSRQYCSRLWRVRGEGGRVEVVVVGRGRWE